MRNNGIFLMFLASFLFAMMNVLVKFVPRIPAVEIVFFRSLVSFVLSWYFLYKSGTPLFGTHKKLLLSRGIFGTIALVLAFYLLQNIPLASAITILYMSPIFTTILSIFMVGEKIKPLQWLFFLVAFGGVVIIQGFDPRIDINMLIIGLVSSFFMGLAYNTIKKIGTKENPLVIIFYFPMVAMPLTGVYSAFNWVMPEGIEWLLLLLIGVVVQLAQYFMTMAYQKEDVSRVVSIKYFGIIYALGFGWFVFDEFFGFWAYVGMAGVLAGVIGNLLYTQKIRKKKIDR